MNELRLDDLLKLVGTYNEEGVEQVKKAYYYAERLHEGQTRQSGEPYISHPLNVAYILAELHADTDTICAGLLHDVLEDTKCTKEEISNDFNESVANLVDGVTKISKMNFNSKKDENLANTRKIVTGITNDVRIIIVKLADRLHNMRTLHFKPSEFKRKENAKETLELFVPLAYSMGFYKIKTELEELSFKHLYPEQYKKINEIKEKIEEENNDELDEICERLKSVLEARNINCKIEKRIKNSYGIYKNISEGKKINNIHDLLAIKIVVDDIESCFLAYGLVHSILRPDQQRSKDYIFSPKTNGYQSLHTTVFRKNGGLVQIQIRDKEMDDMATNGLASYWNFENENAHKYMQADLEKDFQFYDSLLKIVNNAKDDEEFNKNINEGLLSKQIYVYNSKGEIIQLPEGATVIDLAYALGEEVGNTLTNGIVNGKIVGPEYKLSTNDKVDVITDEMTYGSRKDWLELAKTPNARYKIKRINQAC